MRTRHAFALALLLALLPAASAHLGPPLQAPGPCDQLRLNEVLPHPQDVDWNRDCLTNWDDQWVELYNPGDTPCDAGGWLLARGGPGTATPYTIPDGTILDPHGYAVLYKSGAFALLPSAGEVWLWWPGGTPEWCQYYTSWPDRSINRIGSAAPAWDLNPEIPPSPGQANGSVQTFPQPGPCTPTPGPATATPSPSPTPSATPSPSPTPSKTATPTRTPTASRTPTPSPTATPSPSVTPSPTPSPSTSATPWPSPTASHTSSPNATRIRPAGPAAAPSASPTTHATGAPPTTTVATGAAEPPTATPEPPVPSASEHTGTPTNALGGDWLPLLGILAFFGWLLTRRSERRE